MILLDYVRYTLHILYICVIEYEQISCNIHLNDQNITITNTALCCRNHQSCSHIDDLVEKERIASPGQKMQRFEIGDGQAVSRKDFTGEWNDYND